MKIKAQEEHQKIPDLSEKAKEQEKLQSRTTKKSTMKENR